MEQEKIDRDLWELQRILKEQLEGLPEEVCSHITVKYPADPFYMRGEHYSPIDLNLSPRQAWIDGYKYSQTS